jgi:mxaJ protein
MRKLLPIAAAVMGLWFAGTGAVNAEARELRVCADPNNLPFSNDREEGFENKIVALVAADLQETPHYFWWAQRRGFVRNTLQAEKCDLWPGVATKVEMMTTTRPYYRSTYVFVSRPSDHLAIASFDDRRLRRLTIGVQMVGNDGMNTPPAHALAQRGMIAKVRGFMLYGDYRRPSPPAAIVDAVANRQIDVALVWGPLAGYFAAREKPPLSVEPLSAANDGPAWPMQFDISMGVRKGNTVLSDRLDAILSRERPRIDAILDAYHVPRVIAPDTVAAGGK